MYGDSAKLSEPKSGMEVTIPKLCPVCLDQGYCPNKSTCLLVCWFCNGQIGFFPESDARAAA